MAQVGLLPFVQKFEGYNPKPYWDYKQWSVGYGTRASGPNDTIDKAEADRRLQSELDQARGFVSQRFPNLAPHQADALTSFTYNLGPGWMHGPTRLRAAIEAGDYQTAAQVMQQYNKAGGEVLPGLQKRRAAEAAMFLGGPAPTSLLQTPGAPPMQSPQQNNGWLGLLSDRFQSPLFMMGASIFNQAYQPGGNVGAGMMEGLQASNMMQRQRRRDQREQAQFDQTQAAGPLLQSAFQGGEPDIGALLANPATRDIGLTLYKEKMQQSDPLRQAQVTYYGAQARKAEADANRKEDPDAVFRQRERIADQQGLPAGSPERRQFVLTGELPKGERQTSTDKKEILEGVQTAQTGQAAISLLNQAKTLSGQAYSGLLAKQRGMIQDATIGGQGAQATVELDQIVTSQALEQLKATFGGAPTEGERKILLQIQGAANLSRPTREAIYDRAIKLAQVRVEYEKAKAEAIRDGSIYKPGFKMPSYEDFAAKLGLDLNDPAPAPTGGKTAPGEPLPKGGIRILGVREPGAR